MAKLTFCLYFIFIFPSLLFARTKQDSANVICFVQSRVNHLIRIVNNRHGKSNDTAQNYFLEIKKNIDSHYEQYFSFCQVDSIYRKSFFFVLKALNEWDKDNRVLLDIIDELKAKKSMLEIGLEANCVVELPVEVITLNKDLRPISGYNVFWNFWLDKDDLNSASNFNNFTNLNAIGFLRPGVYDIWVKKVGQSIRYPSAIARIKRIVSRADSKYKIEIKIIVQ